MSKNVKNDLLNYNLKIVQNDNFFKFSLDSIMLAEFVRVDFKDKVLLDLCTGNAPLPLILSASIKEIVAIELQEEINKLAQESIEINNITNIKLINDDIKNIDNYFPGNNFDIVTCNPPYFRYEENSKICEDKIKATARHEVEIKLEEIIQIAYNNLRSKGKFYLVHRADRLIEIIKLLNDNGFGIKKMQMIHYNSEKECSMILLEAKKNSKHDVKVIKPLFAEKYGR